MSQKSASSPDQGLEGDGKPRGHARLLLIMALCVGVLGLVSKNGWGPDVWKVITNVWYAVAHLHFFLWEIAVICIVLALRPKWLGSIRQMLKNCIHWAIVKWKRAGEEPMGQPLCIVLGGFSFLVLIGVVLALPPMKNLFAWMGRNLGWGGEKSSPFLRDVFIALGALITVAFAYWRARQNDEKNRIDDERKRIEEEKKGLETQRLETETFRQAVQMLAATADSAQTGSDSPSKIPAMEQRIGAMETLRQIVLQEYLIRKSQGVNGPGSYRSAIIPILTTYVLQNAQVTVLSVEDSEELTPRVRPLGPDIRKAFEVLWDLVYPVWIPQQDRWETPLDFRHGHFEGLDLSEVLRAPKRLRSQNKQLGKARVHSYPGPPLPLDFGKANLQDADLSATDLQGADFSCANLLRTNLSRANLHGVIFEWCSDLSNATLIGTNLQGADLAGIDLRGANLSKANLQGADLSLTNLQSVDFSNARLQGANLSEAKLQGAVLRDAYLHGASLSEPRVDLTLWTGVNWDTPAKWEAVKALAQVLPFEKRQNAFLYRIEEASKAETDLSFAQERVDASSVPPRLRDNLSLLNWQSCELDPVDFDVALCDFLESLCRDPYLHEVATQNIQTRVDILRAFPGRRIATPEDDN